MDYIYNLTAAYYDKQVTDDTFVEMFLCTMQRLQLTDSELWDNILYQGNWYMENDPELERQTERNPNQLGVTIQKKLEGVFDYDQACKIYFQ